MFGNARMNDVSTKNEQIYGENYIDQGLFNV